MALVKRSDKLAFWGLSGSIVRMSKFTSISTSKNAKEYSRQYIDEAFESTDVTGYSPSIAYAFDQYSENLVHADIVDITDSELMGDDALRYIYIVDKTNLISTGVYGCKKRSFAVIPDGEGDSTDAYTYSGNLKVKGTVIEGTASSSDDWQTITFTATSGAEYLVTFNVSAVAGQIAGAQVVINGQVLITDDTGIASIELPAATYAYTVTKSLYTTVSDSLTVSTAAIYEEVTIVLA